MNDREICIKLGVLAVVVSIALSLFAGCSSASLTATPIPPVPPAPPVAPTAASIPTPPPASVSPTPPAVAPTQTKTLPTPTPVLLSEQIIRGGTLRYASRMSVDTLDPHFSIRSDTYAMIGNIYAQILQVDKDGNVLPSLVQTWEVSSDGKKITLHLQKGIKFQDGTEVNAQAVKWNFDLVMDPQSASPRKGEIGDQLDRTEVVDESTFALMLSKPFRPFLTLLASERLGFLVSPSAVAKLGKDFGAKPVGGGPFRFVEWVPDDHIRLVRNEGYWEKGKPYLDAIHFQSVPDPAVQFAMLRTAETDVISSVEFDPAGLPLLEKDPRLTFARYDSQLFVSLQFDVGRSPYNNKALRQAVGYSMDKDAFVKVVLGGAGKPAYTLLGKGWGFNSDIKPIGFDLTEAKKRLAEAGYPNGATIPLGCASAGINQYYCEVFQAMLAKAGVNAQAVTVNVRDYTGPAGCIKIVGLCVFRSGHRIDPHVSIERMYHSKGYFGLVQHYNNPEVDRLIEEAATVYDTAKAKLLYDQIQKEAAEDAVLVFAAYTDSFLPMNRGIKGFVSVPDSNQLPLRGVWLAR